MPVLPKHYWEGREFDKPSLNIPLTSSAYKIAMVIPGRSITQELDNNYWGKDLPVNRGINNFKINLLLLTRLINPLEITCE